MANTDRNLTARKGSFGVLANGISAANTAQTVSTPGGRHMQIAYATVKYSAAPTQTGATVTINSGIAADYDTLLTTGSANVQSTLYMPDGDLILCEDDVLDVVAPAGGAGITSAVAIYGWRLD